MGKRDDIHMSRDNKQSLAEIGRRMIAQANFSALATIDRRSGGPSASLIAMATLPDNTPLFLISTLAEHTKNLAADARASLLLDETRDLDDPLTGPRLTLIGTALPLAATGPSLHALANSEPGLRALARQRYLARHPGAETYVDFADFDFYRFKITHAHYVGGFGAISSIPGADLTTAEPSQTGKRP